MSDLGQIIVVPYVAPATSPHRYWRIYTTWTQQNAAIMAEVQLRAAVGGADQTAPGGTVGNSGNDGSNLPAAAVDNNAATFWWSNAVLPTPVWWSYDFGAGAPKDIVEITLQAHPGNAAYTPRAFQIQYSDDNSVWTTAWGEMSVTAWTAGETRTFTRPVAGSPIWGGPDGNGNRTSTVTVTSTNSFPMGSPSLMVNGDNTSNSAWWTAGQSNREVLFEFGVGVSRTIDGIAWYQDQSSGNGTWVLEGSNDNSSYTTFPESFTLGDALVDVQLFTNTNAYHYYRLRQTAGVTSNVQYLREIEFKIK